MRDVPCLGVVHGGLGDGAHGGEWGSEVDGENKFNVVSVSVR